MDQVSLLNPRDHRNVTVNDRVLAKPGDGLGSVMVVVDELLQLQREYPVFIKKDSRSGQFFLSALLGLQGDEDLQSTAYYRPLMLDRGPFLIGYQGADAGPRPVVYIDLADPRVNSGCGGRLFDDAGEMTDTTATYIDRLHRIHEGKLRTQAFVSALATAQLIEPVSIDVRLNSGQDLLVKDIYTVTAAKLNALSAEHLCALHSTGFLSLAYALAFSVENVKHLIAKKNGCLTGFLQPTRN